MADSTILLLGHAQHGKTTLFKALTGKEPNGNEPVKVTKAPHSLDFYDVSGHEARMNKLGETDKMGINIITCGLLVVSAVDGPMPETSAALKKAQEVYESAAIKIAAGGALVSATVLPKMSIVVFINKTDLSDDDDTIDLVQLELEELLDKYGFPSNSEVFVRGSALKATEGDATEQAKVDSLWKKFL